MNSRHGMSTDGLDELRGKIPDYQMWCGCQTNKLYFDNEDRFIQHLRDEHKSTIPEIVRQIRVAINEVKTQ